MARSIGGIAWLQRLWRRAGETARQGPRHRGPAARRDGGRRAGGPGVRRHRARRGPPGLGGRRAAPRASPPAGAKRLRPAGRGGGRRLAARPRRRGDGHGPGGAPRHRVPERRRAGIRRRGAARLRRAAGSPRAARGTGRGGTRRLLRGRGERLLPGARQLGPGGPGLDAGRALGRRAGARAGPGGHGRRGGREPEAPRGGDDCVLPRPARRAHPGAHGGSAAALRRRAGAPAVRGSTRNGRWRPVESGATPRPTAPARAHATTSGSRSRTWRRRRWRSSPASRAGRWPGYSPTSWTTPRSRWWSGEPGCRSRAPSPTTCANTAVGRSACWAFRGCGPSPPPRSPGPSRAAARWPWSKPSAQRRRAARRSSARWRRPSLPDASGSPRPAAARGRSPRRSRDSASCCAGRTPRRASTWSESPSGDATGFPRRDALLQSLANTDPSLREAALPETEPPGADPPEGRSAGAIGLESELPPDALSLLAEAAAAACGSFVRGAETRPEPGVWEGRVRAAARDFPDPGPRAAVSFLLVGANARSRLGNPLAALAARRRGAAGDGGPPGAALGRSSGGLAPDRARARAAPLHRPARLRGGARAAGALLRGDEGTLLEAEKLHEVRWRELPALKAPDARPARAGAPHPPGAPGPRQPPALLGRDRPAAAGGRRRPRAGPALGERRRSGGGLGAAARGRSDRASAPRPGGLHRVRALLVGLPGLGDRGDGPRERSAAHRGQPSRRYQRDGRRRAAPQPQAPGGPPREQHREGRRRPRVTWTPIRVARRGAGCAGA